MSCKKAKTSISDALKATCTNIREMDENILMFTFDGLTYGASVTLHDPSTFYLSLFVLLTLPEGTEHELLNQAVLNASFEKPVRVAVDKEAMQLSCEMYSKDIKSFVSVIPEMLEALRSSISESGPLYQSALEEYDKTKRLQGRPDQSACQSPVESCTQQESASEEEEAVAILAQMIENYQYINSSFSDILKIEDWECLVKAREKALDILQYLDSRSFGIEERPEIEKLLSTKMRLLGNKELLSFRKVRSIQVSNMGIFSYPFFNCRFINRNGKLFFEKTSGSQRKSGYVYPNDGYTKVFLGGSTVNEDPQTTYDSEDSVAGLIYKIAENKAVILFLNPYQGCFEIYELTR